MPADRAAPAMQDSSAAIFICLQNTISFVICKSIFDKTGQSNSIPAFAGLVKYQNAFEQIF